MSFYDDMAQMTRELLAPDADGGLGQGAITIRRVTAGTPNPQEPWVPVTPVTLTETLNQISTIKAEYTSGGTIIVTDAAYMLEAPRVLVPKPGDTVEVGVTLDGDGAYVSGTHVGGIVHAAPFPTHGVMVYCEIYVNR